MKLTTFERIEEQRRLSFLRLFNLDHVENGEYPLLSDLKKKEILEFKYSEHNKPECFFLWKKDIYGNKERILRFMEKEYSRDSCRGYEMLSTKEEVMEFLDEQIKKYGNR